MAGDAAYQVYSFRETMESLEDSTALLRDQLNRIDDEISNCPDGDTKRLGELLELRRETSNYLTDAIPENQSIAGSESLNATGQGMVVGGVCGLLWAAPTY